MSVTTWGWLVIACPLAGTTLIGLGWPVLAGRGDIVTCRKLFDDFNVRD